MARYSLKSVPPTRTRRSARKKKNGHLNTQVEENCIHVVAKQEVVHRGGLGKIGVVHHATKNIDTQIDLMARPHVEACRTSAAEASEVNMPSVTGGRPHRNCKQLFETRSAGSFDNDRIPSATSRWQALKHCGPRQAHENTTQ